MIWPQRYEPRENTLYDWGVFDTFSQEWAWKADKLALFVGLTRMQARAQADTLNRIYERAL